MRMVVWDEPATMWLSDHEEDEDGFAASLSKNLEVPWFGVCGGDGNDFFSSPSLWTVTIFLADARVEASQHQAKEDIPRR